MCRKQVASGSKYFWHIKCEFAVRSVCEVSANVYYNVNGADSLVVKLAVSRFPIPEGHLVQAALSSAMETQGGEPHIGAAQRGPPRLWRIHLQCDQQHGHSWSHRHAGCCEYVIHVVVFVVVVVIDWMQLSKYTILYEVEVKSGSSSLQRSRTPRRCLTTWPCGSGRWSGCSVWLTGPLLWPTRGSSWMEACHRGPWSTEAISRSTWPPLRMLGATSASPATTWAAVTSLLKSQSDVRTWNSNMSEDNVLIDDW